MKITRGMVEYVRGLGKGSRKPIYIDAGLCDNFENEFMCELVDIVDWKECCESWSKFSGDYYYPVPGARADVEPLDAYDEAEDHWGGKYGDLRKEFCLHVADFMEGILNGKSVCKRVLAWFRSF